MTYTAFAVLFTVYVIFLASPDSQNLLVPDNGLESDMKAWSVAFGELNGNSIIK